MAERKLARAAPRIAAQLLLGLGASTLAAPVFAQDFPLTRLVDDRTPLPDGAGALGPIGDFALDPTGNLAFVGGGRVFAIVGGLLHAVSDAAVEVDNVEIDGSRVYWSEQGGDGGDAILAWEAGATSIVVDEDTHVPDTDCTFGGGAGGFAEDWRRIGESIVFRGVSEEPGCDDAEGTYRSKDGVIEVLADRRTAIEDAGQLLPCDFASLEGDRVLLRCAAPGGGSALYLREADGTLQLVVGPGYGLLPGASVSAAVLRDVKVVFLAPGADRLWTRPGAPILYAWSPFGLAALVRTGRNQPNLDGSRYRFDGRRVAADVSSSRFGPALYLRGEVLRETDIALDLNETGAVRSLALGEFAGDWLPFGVLLDDGSRAVWAARVDGRLARLAGPGDVLEGRTVLSAQLGRSTGGTVVVGVVFADGACAACDRPAWDALYAAELTPPVVIPAAPGVRFTRLLDEGVIDLHRPPDSFVLDPSGNFSFKVGRELFAGIDGRIHAIGVVDADYTTLVIDGSRVFWSSKGEDEEGGGAIFTWERGFPELVVGEDTSIPGTSCTFWAGENGVQQGWQIDDEGELLFWGRSDDRTAECDGLWRRYRWREGRIEAIPPMVIEDGGSRLECEIESVDGDRRLGSCAASRHDLPALYLFEGDGSFTKVAAPGDPMPGRNARFGGVGRATLRGGSVVFLGSPENDDWPFEPGVYSWHAGVLRTLVEPDSDPYASIGYLFNGRRVATYYGYSPRRKLQLVDPDGSDARLVDLGVFRDGARFPWHFAGDWLPFDVFSEYGLHDSVYAARSDGMFFRILGPGDLLDGRIVCGASLVFPSRPTGSRVALSVSFQPAVRCNLDRAIYAVELPRRTVAIDVRPHGRRNRIHPSRRELVPVALLGSADFDVADVDVASLGFGPGGAPLWRGATESRDLDGDGFVDLLARFRSRETGIARGEGEACLSGETTEGVAFEGCDAVRTVPRGVRSR